MSVPTAFAHFSGWIFVISVAIGAAVGAIGGGVGAIPGAYAGAQVAGYIGLANGISFVANAIVQLVLDIESLFNAQAPEPQIPEYSAEEDCALQSYAGLSDRMRLRLVDLAQQANPAAGAALRGLQVSCEAIASDPQARVEEPERLPCQGDDNNREITLRERYQRIAGNMVVVAFTVVLIFAGAAAATLGRRIVQWVLRTTQGVRQAMFRFMQRVFVPLQQLASPALRRRIFGRNWSGWLRRRFGLGTRDLLGRRRTRIGDQNHELALLRRASGQAELAICSVPPCGPILGRLRLYRNRLRHGTDLRRDIDALIADVETLERLAGEGRPYTAQLDVVRRRIDQFPSNTQAQRRLLRELNRFLDETGELPLGAPPRMPTTGSAVPQVDLTRIALNQTEHNLEVFGRWGHTWSHHGQRSTVDFANLARTENHQIGQWVNNIAARNYVQSIQGQLRAGAWTIDIPEGIGKIYLPNGTEITTGVNKAVIRVRADGSIRTFYPYHPGYPVQ